MDGGYDDGLLGNENAAGDDLLNGDGYAEGNPYDEGSFQGDEVLTMDAPWLALFGREPLRKPFDQYVKHLQVYLNIYRLRAGKCGPEDAYLEENGIMDAKTERALREFQLDHGIYEVDFAGDETKARLYELIGDLIQIPQNTHEPSWDDSYGALEENGNPIDGDDSIYDGTQGIG